MQCDVGYMQNKYDDIKSWYMYTCSTKNCVYIGCDANFEILTRLSCEPIPILFVLNLFVILTLRRSGLK